MSPRKKAQKPGSTNSEANVSHGQAPGDDVTFGILFFSSIHERHIVPSKSRRGDGLIDATRRRDGLEQVSNSAIVS